MEIMRIILIKLGKIVSNSDKSYKNLPPHRQGKAIIHSTPAQIQFIECQVNANQFATFSHEKGSGPKEDEKADQKFPVTAKFSWEFICCLRDESSTD